MTTIVAQNLPPGGDCAVLGLIMLGIILFGSVYAAYRIGYSRGRESAFRDNKQRGFAVLPLPKRVDESQKTQ